jgi:hypothetical protein
MERRCRNFGFRASMKRFILCGDHPDVLNAGVVDYDRAANSVRGYVRLHRRRTLGFVRKWVLPQAQHVRILAHGAYRKLRDTKYDNPWCADVYEHMHDIREKASRR